MNDLLTLLSENARLTAAQLAVMLNKTEAEVAAAVKSYEESGVIKGYKALIDWDKAPVKSASAITRLAISSKPVSFFGVTFSSIMAGAYDFAVIVRAATIQDIAMFVAKRLSTLDSVISTATHFVLTRYKDSGMILCDDGDVDERGDMWL